MAPELAAALVALAVAAVNFLAVELRFRIAKRERERLFEAVGDVERKTGADRRRSDLGNEGQVPR